MTDPIRNLLITPPPELVKQWLVEGHHQDYCSATNHAIAQAARWGADQELEACCKAFENIWGQVDVMTLADVLRAIRAARRPPAASAAGRGGGGMSQPLSPVEELQERYRSAADEYPDPDGFAAALRAVADQVVPEPPTWEIGVLSAADREVEIRREILAIAAELENQ